MVLELERRIADNPILSVMWLGTDKQKPEARAVPLNGVEQQFDLASDYLDQIPRPLHRS